MASALKRPITQSEIETYSRDGVVTLRGLFDDAWVKHLTPLIEATMRDPGPLHLELEKSGGDGRFFFDTFLWPRNAGFKRFISESAAAEIAGTLMAASKVNVFFDQLLIKEPGTEERTPWHHDLPYWPVEGNQVCTLWLALDPVTAKSGAVEYIRGSHQYGERYHPRPFAGDNRYETPYPEIPDFESQRDDLDIAQFDLAPGDCTVHHALTIHGAPGNARRDVRRRAYVIRFAGDDATYAPRENIMPILHEPGIDAGAALDSDLWPVVWRAP